MKINFNRQQVRESKVDKLANGDYMLLLPKMRHQKYTLAQIDDYAHLARRNFPHQAPLYFQLEAKLSGNATHGTWGFGLWNDPFGIGFGAGGISRLFPVLPNAAWFFFGSEENNLTLRDNLPGSGFHIKTYRSPLLPAFVSLLGLPLLPLVFWPFTARRLRRLARFILREDGKGLNLPTDEWHTYGLRWGQSKVSFWIDGDQVFTSNIAPRGRLGIVIWIDNQFFRFDQDGKLASGYESLPEAQWMAVRNIVIQTE